MNSENREVRIAFPEYIRKIIARLDDAGYDAYAVGGCVRDSTLGRTPHDWDVTTAADPHETMRIFADGDIHVIGTAGIRHGTVMVKAGADVCEITTFRSDGDYKDHRRPDSVSFSDTVEEDLSRRDFTMNAIAAKPCGDGAVIVDPFGGIGDISKGVIRTVGDPEKRFCEDALRILRAVRFTSELGFSVDPATADAAVRLRETLGFVSAERITAELWRTLSGEHLQMTVSTFGDIFRWLVGGSAERFIKYASECSDPYVRLALMVDHGTDGSELFARLRFPAKTVSLVKKLLRLSEIPEDTVGVCRLMREFEGNIGTALDHLRVLGSDDRISARVQDVIARNIPYKLTMLAVNGQDARSSGIPDTDIGDALEYLLSSVQAGKIPNEKAALTAALANFKIK